MKRFFIPLLGIETNGLGKFLPAILRREMVKAHAPTAVVEMNSRVGKAARILQAFDAPLAARMIHIHRRVTMSPFMDEFRNFRPDGMTGPDDGIDAVAGAILMEPVRIPGNGCVVRRPLWRGEGVFHAKGA